MKAPPKAGRPLSRRVFLVDDHPLVREWLASLVTLESDLEICGQAEDAAAASAERKKRARSLTRMTTAELNGGFLGDPDDPSTAPRHRSILVSDVWLTQDSADGAVGGDAAVEAAAALLRARRECIVRPQGGLLL